VKVEILRTPAKRLIASLSDALAKTVVEGVTVDLPGDVAKKLVQARCAIDKSPPAPVLQAVPPKPEIAEAVPPIVVGSTRVDQSFRKTMADRAESQSHADKMYGPPPTAARK